MPFRCIGKTEREICERAGLPEKENEFRRFYFREIKRTIIPNSKPSPGAKELSDYLELAGEDLRACRMFREKCNPFARGGGAAEDRSRSSHSCLRDSEGKSRFHYCCRGFHLRNLNGQSAGCFSFLYRPDGYSKYFRPNKEFPPSARIKSLLSMKKVPLP